MSDTPFRRQGVPSNEAGEMVATSPVPESRGRAPLVANDARGRLVALDCMRGLVMVLMAVDHSSDAFNAGRLFTDSAFFYKPGSPLPAAQFLTRWITHLCAPTFLFLAGAGLAFRVSKMRASGESEGTIDRFLATRGLVIAALEIWISLLVTKPGTWLLQVLYAIGTSYLFMIPLRRLPLAATAALGAALVMGGELLVGIAGGADPSAAPLPLSLLVLGGLRPHLIIGYPTVHWLAIMLLGWAWGGHLVANPSQAARAGQRMGVLGLSALVIYLLVRGANGYGNMILPRFGGSLVQWLHVSKYPPSLTYVTLELGIMALCLFALFAAVRRRAPGPNHVLVVLGQTPMFFYLLHFPLLELTAKAFGVHQKLGLGASYAGAAMVTAVLYPACIWYRRYKRAHPDSVARFF